MDKLTQQNAAMVEQATAACASLDSDTQQLGEIIQHFKVTHAAPATQMRSAPAAAHRGAPHRAKAPERQPERMAAQRPVTQMRTTGSGGAATAAAMDDWEEF
ncbi:hypothetical protein DYI37_19680 [Fulvimarina endophytica]|uniref:Methyl-accepting chemotaxis protein n=1 Tax=Fulvimarina endophytica TaxID=2293836 RepID=A0A371WXP2_9HYPH|nr:hypothetical protein DYI37_19680 [Fulvimarina endophytica]